MKLNKNKVLSALTTREALVEKAIITAREKDKTEMNKLVSAKIKELENALEKTKETLKSQTSWLAELKQGLKYKGERSPEFYNKIAYNPLPHYYEECQKNLLDRVRKQKQLTKLVEGEIVDSKVVDIDLTIL